jgi:leucine dehydrogenase
LRHLPDFPARLSPSGGSAWVSSRDIERYPVTLEHEDLVIRRGPRSGLYTMVAVHSTALGPALGGCRMWHYDDSRAAVRDALRLSRAMTYKAAVAGLPLGGGKGVIMRPPGGLTGRQRTAALLDFADTVQLLDGRYLTAEDVGTSSRDMVTIARRTSHVTGLARTRGGSGDPSPSTALGVESAILACCERVFGTTGLAGRTITIVGLGNVGLRLARLLARRRATLLAADIDPAKRALAERLGARWIAPEAALSAPADVLAPCALGGILDHDTVPLVQAPIVAGAANNQLADDTIAELLKERGVLWAPDFVANGGGIINISVELEPGGYDPARARKLVRGVRDTLGRVFDDAQETDSSPLAAALALAGRRLAEAS